jgi:hypothetical protein
MRDTKEIKDPTSRQRRKLRSHFGFSKMPFCKAMWAAHMFDSQSQHEMLEGLVLWSEIHGTALVERERGL